METKMENNMNMTRELVIEPAAQGLQKYLVSLPFDFPEESISRALKIMEPLVRRKSQGEVIHIQAVGDTVEKVLQSLAHEISQL
jgi:hypothetical protein